MTDVYCNKRDCVFIKECPNPEFATCGCQIITVNKDNKCEEYEVKS
jgi:hypothetical protein